LKHLPSFNYKKCNSYFLLNGHVVPPTQMQLLLQDPFFLLLLSYDCIMFLVQRFDGIRDLFFDRLGFGKHRFGL
jgi:hypothetical protein